MDWTGGVRKRYAAGHGSGQVQKQKAHFAKARAALQTTATPQFNRRHDSPHLEPVFTNGFGLIRQHRYAGVKPDNQHQEQQHSQAISALPSGHESASRTIHERFSKQQAPRGLNKSSCNICISTSRSPSLAGSVADRSRVKRRRLSKSPPLMQPNTMTEDENLLLANRRRLLARTDWLGLAAKHPVHIRFPSSRDKERIGKRRKIEKSAVQRSEPANKRLLTPLFERGFRPHDLTMSGALPPEDIQIKIGTDALATQTQRSRKSHTPVRTSMRPPSTESRPLTEESMLLGADGDRFETFDPPNGFFPSVNSAGSYGGPLNQADHEVSLSIPLAPKTPDVDFTSIEELELSVQPRTSEPPHSDLRFNAHDLFVPELDDTVDANRWQGPQNGGEMSFNLDERSVEGVGIMAEATEAETADNQNWKSFLNIKGHSSNRSSIQALRSSSKHISTSDCDYRPVFERRTDGVPGAEASVSTPRRAGTLAPSFHHVSPNEPVVEVELPSSMLQSPSTSLKQIRRLAGQEAAVITRPDEDTNDDELWKQFIIGSGDSSDDQSQKLEEEAGDEGNPPDLGSSHYPVSGLGTSVKSTRGDITVAAEPTSSSRAKATSTPPQPSAICPPRFEQARQRDEI